MFRISEKDEITICSEKYVPVESLSGGQFLTWKVGKNGRHYVAKMTNRRMRALRELRAYLFLATKKYPDRYYAQLVAFDYEGTVTKADGRRKNFYVLLLAYYDHKTLKKFINEADAKQRRKIVAKLKRRVELLHRAGIVHGDLHMNNIIVLETERGIGVRLIDFGLSRFADEDGLRRDENSLNRFAQKLLS